MNPWRKTTQPTKEHRNVTDPQDAVKLLTAEGVHAALVWRNGMRGISIDPHTLLDALTALPDDERLPPQLEELLETGREESTRQGGDSNGWDVLLGVGASYLVGLPGDRGGALLMLWAAHAQQQRAQGAN